MGDFVFDTSTNSTEPDFFNSTTTVEDLDIEIEEDLAEQAAEEPDAEVEDKEDVENMDDEDDYEEYDKAMEAWEEDAMMEYRKNQKVQLVAGIFFATMAALKGFYFAMIMFRYSNDVDYWKNGSIRGATNWW